MAKQKSDVRDQEMPVDKETGRITYEEVVEVSGRTQGQLYSTAREWYVNRFNSAEAVLQMEDKESGKLLGKAFSYIYDNKIGKWKLRYAIKVYLKDGRYKVVITDLSYEATPPQDVSNPIEVSVGPYLSENLYKKNGKPRPEMVDLKLDTIAKIESLMADLKATMLKSKESAEDEW